jgi:hypothetical protein
MTPEQDYKFIPLTKGYSAIVDAADYEWLSQWKWHTRIRHGKTAYAGRLQRIEKLPNHRKSHLILMARQICGLERGDKRVVDHINHNTLDNRRSNLRICLQGQNARNRRKDKDNTSGYKGVSRNKQNGKWIVRIRFNYRQITVGTFISLEDAAKAYKDAANSLFGEFAYKEPSSTN